MLHERRSEGLIARFFVTFRHVKNADNMMAHSGRVFGPVAGAYQALGDPGARAILRDGVTMRELNRAARDVIEEAGFGPYFLHGLGHHVGLNVHDPRVNELKSGMVITIEPGIYISKGSDVDPVYWELGVRIEDSYIVTEDGYEEITHFPR